ncbi:Hypothetical predicted protein [Mytilus galloprovincialis]|uniref:Reverse transcriptase domain-containing protein n=1 Tax=Mytilus galloprovincialis TaxID=29158 RepID=A0A8B6F185_MYTGA|nr:Hypothetical predicted protein [Mytilus galloprovincialis]
MEIYNVVTDQDDLAEDPEEHLKDLYTRTVEDFDIDRSIKIAEVLIEFQNIFAKGDMDLGLFNGDIKHRIHTGEAAAIKQQMRRTPLKFENEEEKHLSQMLDKGVIKPSISDWCSCPVLVRKKDGSLRYCIDFRPLNKVTTKDVFPLPKIESCMDTLRGSAYMSTLDMAAGYWQIEIDEKDRHKTAFVTKYGLFRACPTAVWIM